MSLGLGNHGSTVTYGTSLEEVSIRELQPPRILKSNKICAWTEDESRDCGRERSMTPWVFPWAMVSHMLSESYFYSPVIDDLPTKHVQRW